MKTFIVFSLLLLFSCNGAYIEKKVQEGMADAKSDMEATYTADKKAFVSNCERVISKEKDSTHVKKLKFFQATINNTLNYIDSLKMEMEKLSDQDTKSVDRIKELFLEYKIGDRLFNKLKYSYSLTQEIALTEEKKKAIATITADALAPMNSQKWAEQYFQLNAPTGVIILLYSFKSQLLTATAAGFDGY